MKADEKQWLVIKSFNNNILLVRDGENEKILFGKGIGFGKKFGNMVDKNIEVEKTFIIESKENQRNFDELLNHADSNIVGMCEELICVIEEELHEELDEKIHISLTDHIAFSLRRLQNSEEIQNPFIVETETLYKTEFRIATKLAKIIEEKVDVKIPHGEIGFIALHIHSARNKGKLSNTIKFAYTINYIIKFIEEELDIYVDRESLDFARFATHIRFAIERILNGNEVKNDLLKTIKRTYKNSYKLAEKVAGIIENQLDVKVSKDEVGYLAIHIERFKNMANIEQ